jgi:tight adherence protein B
VTGAAIALAVAVLIAPARPRHRIRPPGRAASLPLRHLPVVAAAILVAVAAAVIGAGVAVAGAAAAVTVLIRGRRRHRRQARIREADELAAALDTLVAELRVGAHPVAALAAAADDTGATVGAALRTMAARARLGADVAAALVEAARDSALPGHWERLAVWWRLATVHGLAIAGLMQTAQCDVVERQRFVARVEAGLAGARTTTAVLAGLPVFGIALGQLIGADPVRVLFTGAGQWLLAVGVLLVCLGLLWADRITAGVTG